MTFQYIKSSNSLRHELIENLPLSGKRITSIIKEYPVIGTGWDEKKEYVEGKDFEVVSHQYNMSADPINYPELRFLTAARLTPSKEEGEESQEEMWKDIIGQIEFLSDARVSYKIIVSRLSESFSITRKQNPHATTKRD